MSRILGTVLAAGLVHDNERRWREFHLAVERAVADSTGSGDSSGSGGSGG